ncbi:MAG TPA: protein kinase [Steroidobacteraceae bacterium]
MSEVWTKWESQVINGAFPLRRFLGASDHSAVFLTEHKSRGLTDAAIKLVPAHPAHSDAQLSRWKTAATVSHEHLLRAFDCGRCQLGGHPFLYLLMEYAEENLAQVLPQRRLTAEEARGLLEPTLQGLAYLHGRGLAHGQIKPPNILVMGDQVKLATDTIRPVGQSSPPTNMKWTPYDPPEARLGTASSAGDVWGLGITLVEALTQSLPVWPDGSENVSLPLTLPSRFVDTVRRCLSRNPSARPTISGLEARIRLRPMGDEPVAAAAAPAPAQGEALPKTASPAPVGRAVTADPPKALPVASPAPGSTGTASAAAHAASGTAKSPGEASPALAAAAGSASSTAGTGSESKSSVSVSAPIALASSSGPASARRAKTGSSAAASVAVPAAPAMPGPSAGSTAVASGTGSAALPAFPGTPATPMAPSTAMAERGTPDPASSRDSSSRPVEARESGPRPSYVPQIVAILVVFAIVWALLRIFAKPHSAQQQPPTASQTASPPAAMAPAFPADSASPAATTPSAAAVRAPSPRSPHDAAGSAEGSVTAGTAPAVLHEEVPNISSSARSTIRGHIKISVRVTTDRAGNVVGDSLETSGPSKYFARQVTAAARKWKFAPIQGRDSQQWLLWFELTREGATARAKPES